MESVEDLLLNSLEDLESNDLKMFQWHLKKHDRISSSEMENADRLKTVDMMVARFGPEEAVKITVTILKKMNQNYLAEQLEKKHKEDACAHTLDPNTSNTRLVLSDENRKVKPRLNSEAEKARYFDDHWSDLIQGVTNVQIIADKLCQQSLIHEEQYSGITLDSLTSQQRMRKICDIIRKHNDAVKAKFITILQEEKLYFF